MKRRNDIDDGDEEGSQDLFQNSPQAMEDLVEATQEQLQFRDRDEEGIIHESIPVEGLDAIDDEPPAFSEDDDFDTSLPNSPY